MKKHERINNSFLRFIEKPLLNYLAERMPRWINPDVLTFLGLFASILVGLSYYLTNFNKGYLWLASFGLILNWYGDSLDGTLARFRKIERPRYGYFLDHTIDCISQTVIILGFGLSPYADYKIASLVLVGYLSLSIITYIITNVENVFKFSYGKMGPTEARAVAVIANIISFYFGIPVIKLPMIGTVTIVNLTLSLIAVFIYASFFLTAFEKIIRLSKIDRKK